MTARSFGFSAPLTATFALIDRAARMVACTRELLRSLARLTVGLHRRTVGRRQLAYFDDKTLKDIGLCRDDFPSAVRERLQDDVIRFHY